MSLFVRNWPIQAVLLLTFNFALTWHNLVSGNVPEPYLVSIYDHRVRGTALKSTQDEFFHVPQAQKYCDGDYTWDPKITTPPGL
jgi:alpha-1,2-glucosyltransferase